MADGVEINVSLKTNKVSSQINETENELNKLEKSAVSNFKAMENSSIKFGLSAGAAMAGVTLAVEAVISAVRGVGNVILGAVKSASQIEDMRTQFTTLTGSVAGADKHIRDLQQFAASTPFQLEGIAQSSRILQSFGFATDSVTGILRNLGDIAAVSGNDLKEIALIFGQVSAAGKLTGERLNQLQERGVPILRTLAAQFGTTEATVQKMITDGKVQFKDFEAAMKSMTAEGGLFENGMLALSNTLSGKLSTLADNFQLLSSEAGRALVPISKDIIDIALNAMPQLIKATTTFFEAATPGLVSITALFRIFGDAALDVTSDMNQVESAGESLGQIVAFLSKSFLYVYGVLDGLKTVINSFVTASLIPLVAAFNGVVTVLDALPGTGDKFKASLEAIRDVQQSMIDTVVTTGDELAIIDARYAEQANIIDTAIEKKREEIKIEKEKQKELNKTANTAAESTSKQLAIAQASFDLNKSLLEAKNQDDKNLNEQNLIIEKQSQNQSFQILVKGLGEKEAAEIAFNARILAEDNKQKQASELLEKSFAKARVEIIKQREKEIERIEKDNLKLKQEAQKKADKEYIEESKAVEKAEKESLQRRKQNFQDFLSVIAMTSQNLGQAINNFAQISIDNQRKEYEDRKAILELELAENKARSDLEIQQLQEKTDAEIGILDAKNQAILSQKENVKAATLKEKDTTLKSLNEEEKALKQKLANADLASKDALNKRLSEIAAEKANRLAALDEISKSETEKLQSQIQNNKIAADDIKKRTDEKVKTLNTSFDAEESRVKLAVENEKKARQEAALSAFRTQQASNIAQAIISSGLAIIRLWSDLGPIGASIATAGVGALLASQIAVISNQSPPRFATGGIVPGNNYSGDQVSARLNSGEMVLNRSQQRNLFSLINNNPALETNNNPMMLENRLNKIENMLYNQPVIINIDGIEIARASRAASQAGFS